MHNIWSSGNDEEKKEKYKAFSLEPLITGESTIFPISIKDNPLLFLLGLVDTIEPIKSFDYVTPKYVLENILISFDKKQNWITIVNKKKSGLDFEKIRKKIYGLKDWLDVDIENCDEKIIIKIIDCEK